MGSDQSQWPPDHFGVCVQNEMDERRLRYLVDRIGEAKLRVTIVKHWRRYPESKPFVSWLLKQHRIKVPTHVYSTVSVPVYRVYLLVHRTESKLKIGYSGNWLRRASQFTSSESNQMIFDPDLSICFSFGAQRSAAAKAETAAKRYFASDRVVPSADFPRMAGGYHEWFDIRIYDAAKIHLAMVDSSCFREHLTLRNATLLDLSCPDNDQVPDEQQQN